MENVVGRLLRFTRDYKGDKRYSPSVYERWLSQRRDVIHLISRRKPFLAIFFAGTYGAAISQPFGRIFLFRKGWPEPVPIGDWLMIPEKEWKVDWEKISLQEKAMFEVRTQARIWAPKEFYMEWLGFYAPHVYDGLWWDGGGCLLMSKGLDELNQKCRSIVLGIRKRMLE